MGKKWEYQSKEGIFTIHRNYNERKIFRINYANNFEHSFFRCLNFYSTLLRFYSYSTEIFDRKSTIKYSKYFVNQNNKIKRHLISNTEVLKELSLFFKYNNGFIRNNNEEKRKTLSNKLIDIINKIKSKMKTNVISSSRETNDYNKIVVCSSFRRLQDKAQVYSLEESDYPRTRLTHSIEVAGTAKKIAHSIKLYGNYLNIKMEKILESACLIHDVGNPPFGHYGEKVIRNYFKNNWDKLLVNSSIEKNSDDIKEISKIINKESNLYLDFIYFDGNAQSLRVMSKLQEYKNNSHLELLFSILGSIIKYPVCSSNVKDREKPKIGYFYSEEDIIEKMRAVKVFSDNYRNPLSLIVEAADDISYITSDLDDAIKKKIITYEIFDKEILKYNGKEKSLLKKFNNNFLKYYKKNKKNSDDAFYYTMKFMLIELKEKAIKEVVNLFNDNYHLIFNQGIDYLHNQHYEILEFSDSIYGKLLHLLKKNLIIKYVFPDSNVIIKELKGEKIINFLLNEFVNSVLLLKINKNDTIDMILDRNCKLEKECRLFNLISKNYFNVFIAEYSLARSNQERVYYKLRFVVDYISGMTDTYSNDLYIKLN